MKDKRAATGRGPGSCEPRTRSGTPWKPRKRIRPVRLLRAGLRLPRRLIRLMGTMPDGALAKLAGVHPNTIHHERRRRGLPSFKQRGEDVRWTAEMIRKLGTATDRSVADALGVGVGSISYKRRVLGIPPHTEPRGLPHPRAFPWAPEDLARLGTTSDRALAKELGISTGTVATKRRAMGIGPWRPRPQRVVWTRKLLKLLGKVSDMEIARRFSIASSSVLQKRRKLGIPPVVDRRNVVRTPELRQLLSLPPSEVRRRSGLNHDTIAALKKELGIRSLRASEMRYGPEIVARMGREPDATIAADIGSSPSAVLQKRQRLGIPAYRQQGRKRVPRSRG